MKRLVATALVVVALALSIGLAVGMSIRPPAQRVYIPGAERVLKPRPQPAVTITGQPVIRYRDRTPGSCLDALVDADSLLTVFGQYRALADQAQQALLDNDPATLAKVTGRLDAIKARVNPDLTTYGNDAARCRGLERVK